jgi:hypothetical protein
MKYKNKVKVVKTACLTNIRKENGREKTEVACDFYNGINSPKEDIQILIKSYSGEKEYFLFYEYYL